MKWTRHYSGLDFWNPRGNGSGWYAHRDSKTKHLKFLRWSRRGFNACMFFGYLNHLRMMNFNWGWEFSLSVRRLQVQVGIALPEAWNPLNWKLNPNVRVRPRRWLSTQRSGQKCAIRLGWLCLGCEMPKQLAALLDDREWKKRQAADEAWFAEHPEPEYDPCDPLYGERMDSADMGEC